MGDDKYMWPNGMANIAEVIRDGFLRSGMTEDDALKFSGLSVLFISEYVGGSHLYIPKGDRIKIWLRDREIFSIQGKMSVRQIARKFNLSEMRVYEILKDKAKRQQINSSKKTQGEQ